MAEAGLSVTVYDAMRSVGRKFLVAGKSGLNLTNGEDITGFFSKYSGDDLPEGLWQEVIRNFDNTDLRNWAAGLGIETFVASSGKVFPSPVNGAIKAAPLLRRWIEHLRELGVVFKVKHRWVGFDDDGQPVFDVDDERMAFAHEASVLALGGASWPQTGSDGHWTKILHSLGVVTVPLSSANCGWETDWPDNLLEEAEGLPLKNLCLSAGESARKGELVITRYGLEGGPIYRLGPAIRKLSEPHVIIDFKPEMSHAELVQRMGAVKRNFVREAGRRWKLDAAACALLKYLPDRGPWKSSDQLAREVKRCRIPLTQPRPIAEAISSAGGISWNELDKNLMLKKIPRVYIAGEMIDWEAPTGGYLLQACFATGTHAARAVIHSNR